jgi:hypothetical protein
MKFPQQLRLASPRNFTVEHGLMSYELVQPTPLPRLLRFVLPPFQRPEVWTLGQKSRFIESLWLGLPISVYAYNQSETLGHTDNWLIDGQQRWTAIRDFVNDEVEVFDGLMYSDMTLIEKRKFRSTNFPCILLQSDDESELREIYTRLAYGGTPH